MAILSEFPTTQWVITLSATRSNLAAGDVTITLPTPLTPPTPALAVSTVTGSGTSWVLMLNRMISELPPGAITIGGLPATTVVSTDNAEIAGFMQQIRNLLRIGMDAADLPDATIRQLSYLRKAEFSVYEETKKTEADYDNTIMNDAAMRDRFRIATMYHTAALLVPALPDIVREEFQQEYRQYVQMTGEEKIALFLNAAKDAVDEVLPPTDRVESKVGELGTSYTKYTAF